jgi:F420-dependent oxidoreductase-like protein
MRFAMMIEGQEDVAWDDWVALARACEEHGVEALFRSDHYLSVDDRRERGSLDAWGTICALAAITSTVRLGTLVSPATFRHPSVLAKLVVTADHVSNGRIELGIGTGWWEAEHRTYGFPFPPMAERMERLAEQVEIIRRQWAGETFSFDGRHYKIENLAARPVPVQQPHPPLIMGGRARPRSAGLAARWATEYNVVHEPPDAVRERRAALDAACHEAGRDPATLPLSLINGFAVGETREDLHARLKQLAVWRGEPESTDPAAYGAELAKTWIVGTVDEVVQRLREYREAGVTRVMFQHHLYRDLDAIALLARDVFPALAT